ncbi:DUF2933 domain-containing protein [Rhodobacteraceae bacterium LMO-12]|nr:DUF2933 domain-containing protein [Rhodobacteraceae bacterium LMO-JJ12]
MKEVVVRSQSGTPANLMKYGMWACCAVMFVPIAIYFAAGGLSAGVTSNIFVFAPLLLCVGAHFVMHRFMGKSCHNTSKDTDIAAEKAPIPVDREIAAE